MHLPRHSREAVGFLRPLALIGLVLWAAPSCGGNDSTNPPSDTTAFFGVMAGSDGSSGKLSVEADGVPGAAVASPATRASLAVAASAAVLNLSGTAVLSVPPGGTVDLSGTWNTETNAVNMTGGGYTLTGTYTADGKVSGTWDGPNVDGVFNMQVSKTEGEVHVYCGTFTGRQLESEAYPPVSLAAALEDGLTPDNGSWNMVVGATTADVIIVSDEGSANALEGTRSGNTVNISLTGASATGTLTGTGDAFINGTYDITGSSQGTFQGSEAACTATTESPGIQSIVINTPGITKTNGTAPARVSFDSVLVFATAKDAQGNYVAAPDLDWTFTGDVRTNTETLPRGQKWFVPLDWTPTGSTPPETRTVSVTVKSKNNPSATATSSVTVYMYF